MKRRGPEWRKMRRSHLLVYPECYACGASDDVVVHHVRYRGPAGLSERPGDLITLCSEHHDRLHATLGRTPPLVDQLALLSDIRIEFASTVALEMGLR